MSDEQFEFLISQYLDGTLSAEERAAVEARLGQDAEARGVLEEYRTLDLTLRGALPPPAVRWEALAAHLSGAIEASANNADARVAGAINAGGAGAAGGRRWSIAWVRHASRLAVAACLMIAAGVGVRAYLGRDGSTGTFIASHPNPKPDSGTTPPAGSITVTVGPPALADATGSTGPDTARLVTPPAGSIEVSGPRVEAGPGPGSTHVAVAGPGPNEPDWAVRESVISRTTRLVIGSGAPAPRKADHSVELAWD